MRRLFFTLLVVLVGTSAYAQLNTNSPYSSIGFGEQGGLDNARMIGIGNATITALDSSTVNYFNPASYNLLGKGQPLFSLALSSRLSTHSENNNSNFSNVTSIQHFAMAFPIRKHFGLAFGLKPYARKGYDFTNTSVIEGDSIEYSYSGNGGINEVFGGISTDLIHFDSTRLAVGANFGYLFGQSINERSSVLKELPTSVAGGIEQRIIQAASFHYDLGLYFQHKFNPNHSITAAFTFDPSQNLRIKYEDALYYASNVNIPASYDTLTFIGDSAGVLQSPQSLTYGINYTFQRNAGEDNKKRLNSETSVHLNYQTTDWSKFSVPFDTTNPLASTTTRYSFGLQFTPESDFINNISTSKFLERIRYRVGAYYATLPYMTNNEQVTDFGTTFGFGIPVAIQKSLSSINFGFSIGRRGISDTQALSERYYGINLGISIAPGVDKWFVKRKLN